MIGIDINTVINWAKHLTLRLIKVTHAFSAKIGVYLVYVFTFVDGLIGAGGLTYITVDAFFTDFKSHGIEGIKIRQEEQMNQFDLGDGECRE